LREDQKLAPVSEYHSKYCCFVKTANFVEVAGPEKKEAAPKKAEGKGKGKQAQKQE
jgi:hypothetical protein